MSINQEITSQLSFQPLVAVLKRMVEDGKPGARKLYQSLLNEIEAVPELQNAVSDKAAVKKHSELIETLLSTIFPPSSADNEGIYAIAFPFHYETIYASNRFKELFFKGDAKNISLPDKEINLTVENASLQLAYNIILRKFYSLSVPVVSSSVHGLANEETNFTKYYELSLNAQFVTVKCTNKNFTLPKSFSQQNVLDIEELKESLPLKNFSFEGFFVIDVVDVTTEQVIEEIKNTLIHISSSSDINAYTELDQHVQTLIGQNDIEVGITPFFRMNDFYLHTETYYKNSLLFRNEKALSKHDKVSRLCHNLFKNIDQPVLYETLTESSNGFTELLNFYYQTGARSLIVCPLKCDNGNLIGLLEISSAEPDKLKYQHLANLKPAMQLLSLALDKINENLHLQVDKAIKEHFTAVQPAVEWKFTEAAFNYLQQRQLTESAKLPSIVFEDVYPLYASVDIRNSSVERNNAIQLDLLEQLNKARAVLEKANKSFQFPLLKEVMYRIDKFIASAADNLLSDDEMVIYDFMQGQLESLFKHLRTSRPSLRKNIDEYFDALDAQRNIYYHHRKAYEESITRINDALDRFVDIEQKAAQNIFPHYFERYITDGIEFNIYIGQTLAPHLNFDEIYVKNLKLWQLTTLAKAARLTHALEKKISLPLQTTQLILAHSIPLTISFRRKERKFDVDGAYNIRYEIIKKRIDKVYIKDSEERLTQPGKIAIVYSQQKELYEYLEYIEFLQAEKLIEENIEHLDLEETQGINGLKAVRVEVNLHSDMAAAKVELSKVTSQQLLNK